jgi:2-polyprenyl-3-methyl-5-hydroxy-6-metoxy-1,4-benzoquinol methylase
MMHHDPIGSNTLNVISKAQKFNRWMYQTVQPYLKGNILEIGSGLGNLTDFFRANQKQITPSDYSNEYVTFLQSKYPDVKSLQIDLTQSEFTENNPSLKGAFDSAFALNVIEHIEDDVLALSNMAKLVKKEGKMVVLVPAYQFLYCKFDKNLGHYKRYNKKSLIETVQKANLKVVDAFYFNAFGILGWWLFGKVLNKEHIGEEMGLYNLLVPVFKVIDKILNRKVGLSVVVVIEV